MTNDERSNRFEDAMLATEELYDYELPTMLIDILADARHWCDQHDESYWDIDRLAQQHYLAEIAEEGVQL